MTDHVRGSTIHRESEGVCCCLQGRVVRSCAGRSASTARPPHRARRRDSLIDLAFAVDACEIEPEGFQTFDAAVLSRSSCSRSSFLQIGEPCKSAERKFRMCLTNKGAPLRGAARDRLLESSAGCSRLEHEPLAHGASRERLSFAEVQCIEHRRGGTVNIDDAARPRKGASFHVDRPPPPSGGPIGMSMRATGRRAPNLRELSRGLRFAAGRFDGPDDRAMATTQPPRQPSRPIPAAGLPYASVPDRLAHGDEFFGRRRVNSDRGVELSLRGSGFQRNVETLDDLARIRTNSWARRRCPFHYRQLFHEGAPSPPVIVSFMGRNSDSYTAIFPSRQSLFFLSSPQCRCSADRTRRSGWCRSPPWSVRLQRASAQPPCLR